jgi:hypothetical protein
MEKYDIDLPNYQRITQGDGWYKDLEVGVSFHEEQEFSFLYRYLEQLENAIEKHFKNS